MSMSVTAPKRLNAMDNLILRQLGDIVFRHDLDPTSFHYALTSLRLSSFPPRHPRVGRCVQLRDALGQHSMLRWSQRRRQRYH